MSSTINLELEVEGDGAWPDLDLRKVIHLSETTIGIAVLPGGTSGGRESVAFRFELPNGKVVIAETTWRLLGSACAAIAARYGWP